MGIWLCVHKVHFQSEDGLAMLYDPRLYQSCYFMAILLLMQFDAKEYDSRFEF